MLSQENQILSVLLKGRKITPIEALNKFNSFRLGARIYNLRKRGYDIKMNLVERNGKRFAQYYLV